jgi:hypothetical protein
VLGFDIAAAIKAGRMRVESKDLIDRYIEDHLPKKSQDKARVADEKRMLARDRWVSDNVAREA